MANLLNDILPEETIPGNRNVLYRRRRVRLEILYLIPTTFATTTGQVWTLAPTSNKVRVGGLGQIQTTEAENTVWSNKVIELAEVTSFNVQSTNGTAIGLGPVGAVIQPWYFQPFKVEVVGKSYMGAFSTTRLNVGIDEDIKKLLEARDIINSQFQNGWGDKIKANLLCFDSNDAANRSVSQEYTGFLDDISIDEGQAPAFVRSYTLRFVGEIKAQADILGGGQGRNDDRGIIAKTSSAVTGYVSEALKL